MDLSEISPEGRDRSQAMNAEQFGAYAAEGQKILSSKARQGVSKGAGVYTSPDEVAQAYKATREPWGGITQGYEHPSPDSYAVSAKNSDQSSVTVPASMNQEQFGKAMSKAKGAFRPQLRAGASLGAFHNAETGNVEFDPSHVVTGEDAAKKVGAATHATGGAYHFGSGMGVFPPHVE